jgi:hypothetical protein
MLFDFAKPSSVTIIPQTPTPLLLSWRLDAATAVSRQHPGQVFRHPIQSGREGITDAVQIDPDVLQISGILTDLPISLGAFLTPPDRAARMYDLLITLRRQRQALSVITSWTGELRNRWISQFTATRGQTTGAAIEISMTVEKLRIVRTQLVPQQLDTDIQLLGMSTVSVGEI